jgi:hypothetical protein
LHENNLAGLQRLQAIQSIPAGKCCAGQGASLERIEVLRRLHNTLFIEHAVLAKGAINYTTQASFARVDVNIAKLVALVEDSGDTVTLLELGNLGADFDDFASAIRACYYGQLKREWIFILGEIS